MAKKLDIPAENRWPAILAVVAVGGLYMALPESLAIGPRWLQLAIICLLLIPSVITQRRGNHPLNRMVGHVISAVTTGFMVWSLILLILALPAHKELPVVLLRSAIALWVTNVLIFAGWYWRLDAGGPHSRDTRDTHDAGAFFFPQMTLDRGKGNKKNEERWSPIFVDYLFLAFNTSTAFSPTDSPVLSRWAKVLTMLQASISLSIVALLAARAVNIL